MEQNVAEESSQSRRVAELEAFVERMRDLLDHNFTTDTARVRAIREAVERGPQGAKSLAEFSYRAEVAQRIALARPGNDKAAQVASETQREAELARLLEEALMSDAKPIAWRVEFENGSMELWPAENIQGAPAFGRWVTPLVAGGPTVDNEPEPDTE